MVMTTMADFICSCCLPEDTKNQRFTSRAIDRQLRKEKDRLRRTVKILLLGSGESGKSTFLKQMRIINGNDFVDEELKHYRSVIYGNIVKGMKVLIDARDKLGIAWGNEDNARRAQFIFDCDSSVKLEETVFVQFVPAVNTLWADSGIRTAFDRRREFQLVHYFTSYTLISVLFVLMNITKCLLARKSDFYLLRIMELSLPRQVTFMMGLSDRERISMIYSAVLMQSVTDGQTDGIAVAYTR